MYLSVPLKCRCYSTNVGSRFLHDLLCAPLPHHAQASVHAAATAAAVVRRICIHTRIRTVYTTVTTYIGATHTTRCHVHVHIHIEYEYSYLCESQFALYEYENTYAYIWMRVRKIYSGSHFAWLGGGMGVDGIYMPKQFVN